MAAVMASLGATVTVGPESPKLLAGTGTYKDTHDRAGSEQVFNV